MKILTTSILVALAVPGWADIFTLKDGTKLDATILNKTLEEYELEVSVTSSIKERRTIKRSEVVDIERVNESDVIFEEKIANLAPAPPFLELSEYDKRIKTLKSFLLAHKMTAAGTKANRMLRELSEEREFIAAGGVKIASGEEGLISAVDREKDALGIDSKIVAAKFQSLVDSRSYLAALRQYDILEKDFFATKAHREAIALMSRLATSYGTLLDRELSGLESKESRRQAAFDRLSSSEQARANQVEEQRRITFDRLWAKEEEEGQSWFTVDTQNMSSLQGAIDSLMKESERLLDVESELVEFDETDALYRKGWEAAGAKNQEELELILDALDEAGTAEAYIDKLVDRFDPTINNPPVEEEADAEEADADADAEMEMEMKMEEELEPAE